MTKEQQDAFDRLRCSVKNATWHQNMLSVRVADLDTILTLVKTYASFDPRLPRDGADLLADLCGEKGRVL